MFDTYVLDRRVRTSRAGWFATSLFIGASLVAALIVGLVAHSYWQIGRLTPKYQPISFLPVAVPPEPPAAVAPPPLSADKGEKRKDPPKDPPTVVQPNDQVKQDPETGPQQDKGQANGDVKGEVGGTAGGTGTDIYGDLNGIPNGTGKKGPPAVTDVVDVDDDDEPTNIPLEAIAAQRTAGRVQVPLSNDVKLKAVRDNNRSFKVAAKICLDATGAPERVELMESSGYAEVDANLLAEMRNWRFRPYQVNKKPVRVCTAYVYRYIIEE